jgi:hypothetical protein
MQIGLLIAVVHTLVCESQASSFFKKSLIRRRRSQEVALEDSDSIQRLGALSDLLVAEQCQITPEEALERLTMSHPALSFNPAEIEHYFSTVGIAHRFPTWAHVVLYDSFGKDSQVLAMHAVAARISEEREIPDGFARIAVKMWMNFCVQFEVLVDSHPELLPYRSCYPKGDEYILDRRFRTKILERHEDTREEIVPSSDLPAEQFAMQFVTMNLKVPTDTISQLLGAAEKTVSIEKIEEFKRIGTSLTRVLAKLYLFHLTNQDQGSIKQRIEVLGAIHDYARQSGLSPELVHFQMYIRQLVWIPSLIEYLQNPVGYLPCFLSMEEWYFIPSNSLMKETLNAIIRVENRPHS